MSFSADALHTDEPPPVYSACDTTQLEPQEQQSHKASSQTQSTPQIITSEEKVSPHYHKVIDTRKTAYTARIFIAGDVGTGKACLMWTYKNEKMTPQRECPLEDNYYMKMKGPFSMPFLLKISHASVRGDVEELCSRQSLSISEDIVLLCFAMDNVESLLSIRDKWYAMMKRSVYSRKVPIILVGTKGDLKSHMSPNIPQQIAREIGAIAYIQSSTRDILSVQNVFNFALQHLHEQWNSGLNKIYEKSLEPELFEERVLKEENSKSKSTKLRGMLAANPNRVQFGFSKSNVVETKATVVISSQNSLFLNEKRSKK
ncbi:hypothetical protein CANMA_003441 [Candida margitis]|uniref:uncharacterized protein n=1 Tax=Candida margitis TaxID=1775924 RepID=UPI002225E3B4|nr:uncharacterized protein CANMA_003441 [Candida margitis]KAI5964931.1 hypothetical protein CANMA_003441 [Candida margitis]